MNISYDDHPGLRATAIKDLLVCPATYKYNLDNPSEPTEAQKFGTWAHTHLLCGPGEIMSLPENYDGRTKEGKAAMRLAKDSYPDAVIVKHKDYIALHDMRAAVLSSDTGKLFLYGGVAESEQYWVEDGLEMKCKPDYLRDNVIIDYKTCTDASPEGFARDAAKYKYHVQAAWYTRGMKHLTGHTHRFIFLAQEKTPPYLHAWYEAQTEALINGNQLCNKAIEILKSCNKTNSYPGYTDDIQPLILPAWA